MTKKNSHTLKEIEELKKWFTANKDKCPQSMQIDRSSFSPDLSRTLDTLFSQALVCHANPKMQGCIMMIKKIKENIEGKE